MPRCSLPRPKLFIFFYLNCIHLTNFALGEWEMGLTQWRWYPMIWAHLPWPLYYMLNQQASLKLLSTTEILMTRQRASIKQHKKSRHHAGTAVRGCSGDRERGQPMSTMQGYAPEPLCLSSSSPKPSEECTNILTQNGNFHVFPPRLDNNATVEKCFLL